MRTDDEDFRADKDQERSVFKTGLSWLHGPLVMPELPTGVMCDTLMRHYLDRSAKRYGLMITQIIIGDSKSSRRRWHRNME